MIEVLSSKPFLDADMEETRIRVNGIALQIRDYEGEGDTIIFLHFSGANLMMWQPALPFFQDRYRLILVDLRGHGKSDRPEAGYHMDDMARDVIGVTKRLNIERAHLVGSSLGAEVGLSVAANYPDKVISLVCEGAVYSEYGPYGTWEGSEKDFEDHVTDQLDKLRNTPEIVFPSIDALVDDQREIFERLGWWNDYVETMVRYGAHELDEGGYTRGLGKRAMEDYLRQYFHCRFEDYYRGVRCPLLALLEEGELKTKREKAVMKKLAALARQVQIVEVSGWVHPYGWLLEPEGVSKAILGFLGSAAC